jgi:hypothetical protein
MMMAKSYMVRNCTKDPGIISENEYFQLEVFLAIPLAEETTWERSSSLGVGQGPPEANEGSVAQGKGRDADVLLPEEKDVGLRLVQHVVDPPEALLHTKVPPLGLGHCVRLRHHLGERLGQGGD